MEGLTVYYVCKSCTGSFLSPQTFLKHKEQKHINEFRRTKCIIFEERMLDKDFVDVLPDSTSTSLPSKKADDPSSANFLSTYEHVENNFTETQLTVHSLHSKPYPDPDTVDPQSGSNEAEFTCVQQHELFPQSEPEVGNDPVVDPDTNYTSTLVTYETIEVEIVNLDCADQVNFVEVTADGGECDVKEEELEQVVEDIAPENSHENFIIPDETAPPPIPIPMEIEQSTDSVTISLIRAPPLEIHPHDPDTNTDEDDVIIIEDDNVPEPKPKPKQIETEINAEKTRRKTNVGSLSQNKNQKQLKNNTIKRVLKKPPKHNPYVLVKKLTPQELENWNRPAANRAPTINIKQPGNSSVFDSDLDPDSDPDCGYYESDDYEPNNSHRPGPGHVDGDGDGDNSNSNSASSKTQVIKTRSMSKKATGTRTKTKARSQNSTKSRSNQPSTCEDDLFCFPRPTPNQLNKCDPRALRDWLRKQYEQNSVIRTNVILLDPDPASSEVGLLPVSASNPIRCKLCSKVMKLESELRIHVQLCWLQNTRRHCFCIICDKAFFRPSYLRDHNAKVHTVPTGPSALEMHISNNKGRRGRLSTATFTHSPTTGIEHGGEEREKGPFSCEICLKSFAKRCWLRYHVDSHKNRDEQPRPFICEVSTCGKTFRKKRHLYLHSVVHSSDRPFICPDPTCSYAGKTAQNLKLHSRMHEEEPRRKRIRSKPPPPPVQANPDATAFDVDDPDAGVNKEEEGHEYKIEVDQDMNIDPFMPLPDWIAMQNSLETLRADGNPNHRRNVILLIPDPTSENVPPITPQTPIECKLCYQKLKSDTEVKVHVRNCWRFNKERHRYCVPCEKVFPSLLSYKDHNVSVHSVVDAKAQLRTKFKCPMCPKEFVGKRYLVFHIGSHQSKEEQSRPYMCEVCGSSFRRNIELVYHKRIHREDKPFKCQIQNCGRSFKTEKSIWLHQKLSHSAARPFECLDKDCSKMFKSKGQMMSHMRSHTGERKYECQENDCGQKFTVKHSLKIHLKFQHGIGPDMPTFPCPHCGTAFNRKCILKAHLISHMEDRPFKCTFEGCTLAFPVKSRLEKHLRKHTGELPFQCEICGKGYGRDSSFRRHMKHHQNVTSKKRGRKNKSTTSD